MLRIKHKCHLTYIRESWATGNMTKSSYNPRLIPATVAGALTAYDLPDIAACLAPRELAMINVTDHNKERAMAELIEHELSIVRSAYSAAEAEGNLYIGNWEAEQGMGKVFSAWIKK